MGIVNNALAGSSGQSSGYNLTRSLRFRSSASAYLSRSPSTTTTTRTAWTWSGWVKLGQFTATVSYNTMFSTGTSAFNYMSVNFANSTANDQIVINADGYQKYYTNAVFRDPSAWYHVVVAFNSNASAGSRIIVYINGVQQTTVVNNEITSGFSSPFGVTTNPMYVGRHGADASWSSFYYADFYLTEINWIDGQALTPSSFGETSASTGVWVPKKYTGTYGTNGFYLAFTDNSAATAAAIGKDSSGNGNNWTPNNISVTAGSTYDSMTDVPTLTSDTAANYCVLSPVDTYDNPPTEGNLRRTGVGHTGSPWSTCRATLGVSSGKWYFEGTFTGSTGSVGNNMIGVMTTTTSTLSDAYGGSTTRSYQANGNLQGDNSTGTVSSATSGDVIMIAFDVDAGKLWVGKNGTWMNSGVPASGTGNVFTTLPTSPIVPQVSMYGNTGDNYGWFTNFGQRPFAYTPPTGFVALNTFNLPTPTIGATASTQANKYMSIATRTGNGSTYSVTGVPFAPDLVWTKPRSAAYDHMLADSVRGATKALRSNLTASEMVADSWGYLSAFNSDGYTAVPGSANFNSYGANGVTYVDWMWKANGSGSTNTAGSITSTVSANTTAGFSIVTWTGSGSTATIGHGLGVAPKMIIWMHRTNPGAYSHGVYHASLPSAAYAVQLNLTNAQSSDNNWWNSTAPTSSVFTVGGYNISDTMVAYCFAEVAGYSAFGSYTGNGSSDGPFVFTGFRPRWVMVKNATAAQSWQLMDTSRSTYNVATANLLPNSSSAELTGSDFIDMVSNGFKIRQSSAGNWNNSGNTYIYACFAENPFKYANAR